MAARQASLDFIISESLLKLRSVESVMPCTLTLTVSSSVSLFYCLQSFLASEKRESIKAILVSPCPWRGGALALLGVPSFLSGGGSLTGADGTLAGGAGTLRGWRPAQVPRPLRGEAEPSRSSTDFSVLGAPHTGPPTYSPLSSHTIQTIVPQTERRVR